MIEDNPRLKDLLACELDAWVENDPYLSPGEAGAAKSAAVPRGKRRLCDERKDSMKNDRLIDLGLTGYEELL